MLVTLKSDHNMPANRHPVTLESGAGSCCKTCGSAGNEINLRGNELTHSSAKDSPPSWQLRRSVGSNVLAVGGDWIAQSGRVPEFPAGDLHGTHGGATLAFDTVRLGKWDTGLVVFLWDARRAATNAGLAVDDSALPDAARKLLDLLPDRLSEPQKIPRRGFQPFNWLGGKTIGMFAEIGVVSELLASDRERRPAGDRCEGANAGR